MFLVHAAIPSDVARAAVSVAIHVLVVLMEHRVLASTPLAVCIRNWRILGKNTGEIPVEQVGVVHQGLGMKSVVVHHDGSVAPETSSATKALLTPPTHLEQMRMRCCTVL